ncbi:MAG: hypothetical protein Q4C48_05105 [Lachnospiraceae bacterium]|nr:hypothetical protein [Lachnospiraceae bacterium]
MIDIADPPLFLYDRCSFFRALIYNGNVKKICKKMGFSLKLFTRQRSGHPFFGSVRGLPSIGCAVGRAHDAVGRMPLPIL